MVKKQKSKGSLKCMSKSGPLYQKEEYIMRFLLTITKTLVVIAAVYMLGLFAGISVGYVTA